MENGIEWARLSSGTDWEKLCHELLSFKHTGSYQSFPDKKDAGIDGLVLNQGIIYINVMELKFQIKIPLKELRIKSSKILQN